MSLKNIIKSYNQKNLLILGLDGLFCICTWLVEIDIMYKIILTLLILVCLGLVIGQTKQQFKINIDAKRKEHLGVKNIRVLSENLVSPRFEYIKETLPTCPRASKTKFNLTHIAKGRTCNGKEFDVDYLEYVASKGEGKYKQTLLDFNSYLIRIKLDDSTRLNNRKMLYPNYS